MICRRCYTRSYDVILSMCSTYGDFSGTTAEYDRYCDKCDMLVQRGYPRVYPHSFRCYEDWESHRIKNKDTKCRICDGKGTYHMFNKSNTCYQCEGTGKFPSPSRIKKLEEMKKDKAKYPKYMSIWDLFIALFNIKK